MKIIVVAKNWNNSKFLWRAGKAIWGHLADFGRRQYGF